MRDLIGIVINQFLNRPNREKWAFYQT